MRMVIEVTDSERDAIKKFAASQGVSYSAVFRAMFRLALTGKVAKKDLASALAAPRAEIHVTLEGGAAKGLKADLDTSPATPKELAAISSYIEKHPGAKVNVAKWRAGEYE